MKNAMLALLLVSMAQVAAAQPSALICGTKGPQNLPLSVAAGSPYVSLDTLDTVLIPIARHIVRYGDGTHGISTSEFGVAVTSLNNAFARARIMTRSGRPATST